MRSLYYIIFITLLTLAGCGGDTPPSSNQNQVSSDESSGDNSSGNNDDATEEISLEEQGGEQSVIEQQVGGQTSNGSVVDDSFTNVVASLRQSSASEGNLTLGVSAADPDGITQVVLFVPSVNRSFFLCENNCGADFQVTLTGINPQSMGAIPGPIRFELFVGDALGNLVGADAVNFNWQPIQISAVSASRANGIISINWAGSSSLDRYNLYAATQHGVNSETILDLDNGLQQLAISGTNTQFDDADPAKEYHVLLTGIEAGGESGLSQILTIPRIDGSVNQAPVATTDQYQIAEDQSLVANIIENDSDANGQIITLSAIIVAPVNGSVTFTSVGQVVYRPLLNFVGQDSFIYEITDSKGATAQGTVQIDISAVNDNPVALVDSYAVDQDTTLNGSSVLSNDTDVDGDTLTVNTIPITGVTNGSLTLNSDGAFSYIPDADFNGVDGFIYEINDGNGGTDQGSVDLFILAVNDAPTAVNQAFNVDEDKTNDDVVGTVVVNDTESDTLTFSLTAGDTSLFNIGSSTGIITVKGVKLLDYETSIQHSVTVTISDNGIPIAESTDITVTVNVNDIFEAGTVDEVATFGRPAIDFLELTGVKSQAKLTDSVRQGNKIYFVGNIDNVDKDIYLIAYDKNGTLDTSFGTNGIQTFDFGHNEYATSIIETGGKYYVTFTSDDGTFTEVCFLKIDNIAVLDTSFGSNGISCTTEQSNLSINDASANYQNIFAVGEIQGSDDDLLIIQMDTDGVFIDHTPGDTSDSPHIIQDVSGIGADDEGFAVYSPNNFDVMITGNVVTADGDKDIFAWLLDEYGVEVATFNGGNAQFYDVINTNDEVHDIGGKLEINFTTHLVGSTVLGNGVKEALIIAIDKTGVLVTAFGGGGIATYDADGDAGAGTGSAEFTGIEFDGSELYISGTLFDGQNKPFTTRIFEAGGTVDTVNYGVNGYQKISYATDNAFALSSSLDSDKTLWIPGYVESGSNTNMIISAVDQDGILCNKNCQNDFVDGMETYTHTSIASNDSVAEVVQIENGTQATKFLVVSVANDGTNNHVILSRFTNDGALDTSFDSDGHKQLQIGTSATVNGLFELSDGKFIIYGDVTEASDVNGYIARVDENGNLDVTFASNGIYTTASITATTIQFQQAADDNVGNIIAVGTIDNGSASAFILSLTSAGIINASFNTSGYVIASSTDEYLSLLIDSSNNIYAAGSRINTDKEMLVVKYLSDGSLDASLNGGGILSVDVNATEDDYAEQILFDTSNNLYVIGNNLDTPQQVTIIKSSASGVLDTSFSGDGIASFIMAPASDNSGITDAVIDNQNNIVVVGFGQVGGNNAGMIGRIKPDGELDMTFNGTGFFEAISCASVAQLESVLLLNNSSLIVAGQCYIDATFKNNIEISQYQLN
ncbi:MAG: tandem-95 repeat protein [Colwellia sp.]|nr:tandem-95 repeat protein [Colwellia sp.]